MADDVTPQSQCATPEPLHAIAERLSQWGRPGWVIVLTRWLARCHGVHAHFVDHDEYPAIQMLERLQQWPVAPLDHELARSLARLDFLQWRIARPDDASPRRRPLQETFCQYPGDDPPIAGAWDSEYPAAAETERWLLAELARAASAPTAHLRA